MNSLFSFTSHKGNVENWKKKILINFILCGIASTFLKELHSSLFINQIVEPQSLRDRSDYFNQNPTRNSQKGAPTRPHTPPKVSAYHNMHRRPILRNFMHSHVPHTPTCHSYDINPSDVSTHQPCDVSIRWLWPPPLTEVKIFEGAYLAQFFTYILILGSISSFEVSKSHFLVIFFIMA